jgi:hypothetical protein
LRWLLLLVGRGPLILGVFGVVPVSDSDSPVPFMLILRYYVETVVNDSIIFLFVRLVCVADCYYSGVFKMSMGSNCRLAHTINPHGWWYRDPLFRMDDAAQNTLDSSVECSMIVGKRTNQE